MAGGSGDCRRSLPAYSEPGSGTNFKVYLPLAGEGEDRQDHEEDRKARARGGSETILLVEDEDQVRNLVREVLTARGYEVLVARHGPEALNISQRHADRLDMMLTDVMMPQMNGRELYDRIVTQRPGLKVLFMSGYTDTGVVHGGTLDQGIAFIQKPFSSDALASKIRSVLDGNPEGDGSPAS